MRLKEGTEIGLRLQWRVKDEVGPESEIGVRDGYWIKIQ